MQDILAKMQDNAGHGPEMQDIAGHAGHCRHHDNRSELQYGKLAKSNGFFSRNRPKTLILAIFGALSPS